jgi:hypothetical protein
VHDVVVRGDVEDQDRQVVVHAQGHRGRVHDLEPPIEHFHVLELVELDGVRVGDGVLVVDAVHLGRLHDALTAGLQRAQGGGGVGGEVRVAGAGGEDDDAALLEVTDRSAADVGLGDVLHLDRRHHAREDAVVLEVVLQREPVHDRREHAYVVGLRPVHACR